ncbi:MAG: YneF family protein [Mycoplasmataceae bacterium]|jgi:uncharacterized protein YneF (UPF0154 family)|nr:YneF family protein [Mycoplasmataceae bacterium]
MDTWLICLVVILPILFGIIAAFIGYKLAASKIKNKLKQKPPFNRNQIRAIFRSIGIPISESNVASFENAYKNAMEENK